MTDLHRLPTAVAAPARPYSAPAVLAFVLSLTPFFRLSDATNPALGSIFALVAVLLSVLLGVVALHGINKRGLNGQLFAIAGLGISGIMSAWYALEILRPLL
ncbi:hypothetical protein [Mycobacterium sp.]|uniref:hypothetical protein n=1 Tax=Mycobacterium sp. TaxID=1785 RepID=UPI002C67BFDE|nr:hypothetical protein [Mycobacterium sp.]HTQ18499.1 hypothetical protein [Mycobacterium sp.]